MELFFGKIRISQLSTYTFIFRFKKIILLNLETNLEKDPSWFLLIEKHEILQSPLLFLIKFPYL